MQMNFNFKSIRQNYNMIITSRPAYNPIQTQIRFNIHPPLPIFTPNHTQNSIYFNYPRIIPTPINTINNTRYNPIMTEPPAYQRRRISKVKLFSDSSDSSGKNYKNSNFKKNKKKEYKQINNSEFKEHSNSSHIDIDKDDLDIIEKLYVQNNYSREFNRKLRMFGIMGLNEEDIKLYSALMGVINSHKTQQNFLVHRFVKDDYLESVFNFKPSGIVFNLMMIKQQIGTRKIEKGFMSCYMTDRHVVKGSIQLEIKIPKGTRAYITRNTLESEIILPCNTEYEITGAYIINNYIRINATIINYDENMNLFSGLSRKFK